VATADSTYFDTSALRRLYVHEAGSRETAALRTRQGGVVWLTKFGWMELTNSVAVAEFRNRLTHGEAAVVHGQMQHDLAEGLLRMADLPWRAILDQAARLSRQHTPSLGTRSLDVLHVASALELNARQFVTYDERQAKLATLCGLKVIKP